VTGSMVELKHAIDVNTLEKRPANRLGLNEVGEVELTLSQSLIFDPYTVNPATGAFIVIDRLSNNTVGAGMILRRHDTGKNTRGRVSQQEKELRLGQRGAAVWIDRHIADALERELFDEARTVVRMDAADVDASALPQFIGALTEQGLLVLITSDGGPADSIVRGLGKRLIVCGEKDVDEAIMMLHQHGVGGPQESFGGEGI